MKLRTQLVIAFVTLSVLPLAAVTAYSYRNSVETFRRAVEDEARASATEMGGRVEAVRDGLARHLAELQETAIAVADQPDEAEPPAPPARGPAAGVDPGFARRLKRQLAHELGDEAALLGRLEFVPGAHGPAAGPENVPLDIDPDALQERILSAADAEASMREAEQSVRDAPPEVREQVRRQLAASRKQLREASRQLVMQQLERERRLRDQAEDRQRDPSRPAEVPVPPVPPAPTTVVPPAAVPPIPPASDRFSVPVRRGGHVVGEIRAQVDLGRVLEGALSLSGGDSHEIPFAIDSGGTLHAAGADQLARLGALHIAENRRGRDRFELEGPDGEWVVVTRTDPSTGAVFGIARPVGQNFAAFRSAAGRHLGLGLLAIAIALGGFLPVSRRLTRHLATLTLGAHRIAGGDLETRVTVPAGDEIGELARAFNSMAADLAAHQKTLVQQERLQRELELCRQIQNEMLPKQPLHAGLTEVRGVSIPAREVGGDFFNYFVLDSGEIALLVGDVSGKGVGAALLMANVQATLRARLAVGGDLSGLAASLDREIEAATPAEVYLTLFAGVLDPGRRVLRFVSAGHNTQYLVRAAGGVEPLASTGRPLGLYSGSGYEERSIELGAGDLLFFYTDGVTDTIDPAGEMFGEERLETLLASAPRSGVDALLGAVEGAVRQFRGGAEPPDDATMMVVIVAPAEPARP